MTFVTCECYGSEVKRTEKRMGQVTGSNVKRTIASGFRMTRSVIRFSFCYMLYIKTEIISVITHKSFVASIFAIHLHVKKNFFAETYCTISEVLNKPLVYLLLVLLCCFPYHFLHFISFQMVRIVQSYLFFHSLSLKERMQKSLF